MPSSTQTLKLPASKNPIASADYGTTSLMTLTVSLSSSLTFSQFPVGSVMKSTVINSSKEMTSFSDFPPEDTMPNYMHHTEMCRYLKNYAKNFGLDKLIKLNHSVLSIERNGDYEETGKWKVRYEDG